MSGAGRSGVKLSRRRWVERRWKDEVKRDLGKREVGEAESLVIVDFFWKSHAGNVA